MGSSIRFVDRIDPEISLSVDVEPLVSHFVCSNLYNPNGNSLDHAPLAFLLTLLAVYYLTQGGLITFSVL